MFGVMVVTNQLLLEQMKAMRAELAALARQDREMRDRLKEVHTAVAARKTLDEMQVNEEEIRKIHPHAEREAINSDRPLTPGTRQDREQSEQCWWNELPGTERERLEAEIRARPYEPIRGFDGEVLVAAISDLEVTRIAWEETHPDRPPWQKLPEESFRIPEPIPTLRPWIRAGIAPRKRPGATGRMKRPPDVQKHYPGAENAVLPPRFSGFG